MKFIKYFISAALFGKALSKYQRGRYAEALPLFEKVFKIESSFNDPKERVELNLYHIAWCHRMLRNDEKALETMAAAYGLFRDRLISKRNIDNDYLKSFKELTDEYIKMLFEKDQSEMANKIITEIQELCVEPI